MKTSKRFTKDPHDRLDYGIDWSKWLGPDTITSASWIVPDGLNNDGEGIAGKTTIIWLTGGTAGKTYQLTCRINTAAGRSVDQTIEIACVQN